MSGNSKVIMKYIKPDLASAHYAMDALVRRRTYKWIRPNRKKTTKRPTDTTDWKFLGEFEKECLQ
jgi:hypothetical protein